MVLALLVASMVAGVLGVAPAASTATAATNTDCTATAKPFTVTGAIWGTSSSPVSPYPGDQNVELTVTMLFTGPCTSPQTTFLLTLENGSYIAPFTGPNGLTQLEDVAVNNSPNTIVTQSFYVNVQPTATTGIIYYLPLIIDFENNTASSPLTEFTQVPIALYGTPQISYAAAATHVIAGEENNVTITITNSGTGTAGPVSTTVTAPSTVTLLNELPSTSSLAPGASASQVLEMFVPSSLSSTAFVLTFSGKYLDAYSNSQTVSQTVGFEVSSQTAQSASSFIVTSSQWGTSSATTLPLPGTQDEPLVIELQYLGSTSVTSLQGSLQLPNGVTNLNGGSTATAFSAATTNQYAAVALTFYVNIASSVQPGSYNYTLGLQWMTSQSLGLTESAVVTPPPVGQLSSYFQVDGETWERGSNTTVSSSTTSTSTSPEPGNQDVPLVVSLQYLGSVDITDLQGTLTLPVGVTDLNGHTKATAFATSASSNNVVTLTFDLDFANSLAPGSYNYTLALAWQTTNSIPFTQTAVLTPPPVVSAVATSFPLSLTQENTTLTAGSQSGTGFVLKNVGTSTIYTPTFSLTVGSPVVLASIGSAVPATQLAPGANETFAARLTSSPTSTQGIYGGELTVTFTDSSGSSHTETFPVSFTLEGTIILILQDTSVSQTISGFTVTGSVLDEGSASAYYVSISGLVGVSTATPVYLGEIDPNSPVPFSVTIPFTAPTSISTATTTAASGASSSFSTTFTFSGSRSFNFTRTVSGSSTFSFPGVVSGSRSFAGFPGLGGANSSSSASVNIAISLSFKDTFGNNRVQAFTVPTTVKTASQLGAGSTAVSTSSGTSSADMQYVAYAVVAAVVVVLVVGAVLARRYRERKLASLPPEQRGEQSVI